MENCIFCQIISGEIPAYKVYEDNDWLAFLDIHPVNLGHTLLLPKAHYRNLFDLPENLSAKLGLVMQKVSLAVKSGAKSAGLNVIINNEPAADQLIFHTHIHFIPRFEGDGFKPWHGKGGETEEDFKNAQTNIKELLN